METKKLDELRDHIDTLDVQIVSLLNQRAATALKVGAAKNGQPVYQPARETEVLQRVQSSNQGVLSEEALATIYKEIVAACRNLQ